MKTKQRPTAAATAAGVGTSTVSVSAGSAVSVKRIAATTAKVRSKEEEPIRLRQRQTPTQTQCERERKHEAARKEREAQAQLKRKTTPTTTSMRTARTKTARMPSREATAQITVKQMKAKSNKIQATAKTAATITTATTTEREDEETAQLRLQLEHLAQLSQQDFEREFRKWMAQEGIEGKLQTQVRMDLINSFNNTSLGKLLRKASASVSAAAANREQRETVKNQCILLTPLSLALHTLVAEFLYVHNCHYTLSVFSSELPQRQALPDFESRADFRFTSDELQQLMTTVLGEQLQFERAVMRVYEEEHVSLLLGFFQVLGSGKKSSITTVEQTTQTQPAACLQSHPNVDTSGLFQAKELIVAADGRTVFIGPRVSQSLSGVEQQLAQLLQHMRQLCKSCAPPVEIISQLAFEQLLQQELQERQRLLNAGQILEPGKTALPLPLEKKSEQQQQLEEGVEGNTVLSPAGPIQLPAETASVPELPHLHAEQVASLAMVQQALLQLQQQLQQPQDCMYLTLERMEALVAELAGCIQTLSNVLNLAMEQEYAVGRHKGFKLGYREGFSHGHFMGIQEGMQSMQQQQQQQQEQPKKLKDCWSQTAAVSNCRSIGSQTAQRHQRHRTTSIDCKLHSWRNAGSQTIAGQDLPAVRSYEQWIFEMLHSSSGQIFLERVELSLNKALELQKKRLDELFDVKLRHHAELLRLSNRQSSWRTLCRHVERDSQSLEARDLVHKIFRLLEHYEAHHQLLAEKIQQTEQAAQQAAHIEPVWRNADSSTVGCHVTPASGDCSSPATAATVGVTTAATTTANSNLASQTAAFSSHLRTSTATAVKSFLPTTAAVTTAAAAVATPAAAVATPASVNTAAAVAPVMTAATPASKFTAATVATPASVITAAAVATPASINTAAAVAPVMTAATPASNFTAATVATPASVITAAAAATVAAVATPASVTANTVSVATATAVKDFLPTLAAVTTATPVATAATVASPVSATTATPVATTAFPVATTTPIPVPIQPSCNLQTTISAPVLNLNSAAVAPDLPNSNQSTFATAPPPVSTLVPAPLSAATSNATRTLSTSLPATLLVPSPKAIPTTTALRAHLPTSTASSSPALFTQSLSTTATSADSPGRPLMLNAATNTQLLPSLILTDARVPSTPSFNEALLSAKNRMLQLEQESDLLEQSFLGYLERARVQKQQRNLSASCAREQQQFQQTLDSFRDWQLRLKSEEVTVPAAPAVISPTFSGSELEPESYQFTNAIAVARHKLLSELHATSSCVHVASPAAIVRTANKLLVDQVQDETQELLSRVEATLARVSKPASLQLLAAESQLQLDPLSSGTHSSLEKLGNPPTASRKLQRSMAKMQLLFGNQTPEQTTAKRPWSAPINKKNANFLAPTRPHTAPSSLTDEVAPAGHLQGLLDALSDVGESTTNTSSLASSLNHQPNRNPLQPVGNAATFSGSSSSSSSAALSPSQEFWKRMNM